MVVMRNMFMIFVVPEYTDCPSCDGSLHIKYKVKRRPNLRQDFEVASQDERYAMASEVREVCPSCGYEAAVR